MYAYIRGAVEEITPESVIVDANGVGYELLCSAQTRKSVKTGEQAKLLTYLHSTQDAVALYGFASAQERAMFRRLLGVTRVGPRLALSVLSALTVSDIAAAVYTENAAAFDRVPGMGRKTAARLLLELKEKIGAEDLGGMPAVDAGGSGTDLRSEAVAALVSLGYDGVQAGRAVAAVREAPERIEDMITLALREMVKRSNA